MSGSESGSSPEAQKDATQEMLDGLTKMIMDRFSSFEGRMGEHYASMEDRFKMLEIKTEVRIEELEKKCRLPWEPPQKRRKNLVQKLTSNISLRQKT